MVLTSHNRLQFIRFNLIITELCELCAIFACSAVKIFKPQGHKG